MVRSLSRMTRSPERSVLMPSSCSGPTYCSAIKGLTLGRIPPAPRPTMSSEKTSPGNPRPSCFTNGVEDKVSIARPTKYIEQADTTVRTRPKYWSAMTAPMMGALMVQPMYAWLTMVALDCDRPVS